MNIVDYELLAYSGIVWLGWTLLSFGRELHLPQRKSATSTGPTAWHSLRACAVGAIGLALLVYLALLLVRQNKVFLLGLVTGVSGKEGGLSAIGPLLTCVGLLMALVTAGVINVSKKVLDDVKENKKEIREYVQDTEKVIRKYVEETEKVVKVHRAQMESELSAFQLLQRRLQLLYHNQESLDKMELNQETGSAEWGVRGSLAPLYADGSESSHENLMKFFAQDPRELRGILGSNEKEYLLEIGAFWKKHEADEKKKEVLFALFESVKRKIL